MAAVKTVINSLGKLVGWNSVTFRLLGRDVIGIAKIQYNDEQVSANAHGAGKYPVGIEDGNYTAAASVDLFNEEFRALQDALPSGGRIQDIEPFDITVSYLNGSNRVNDVLHNVRFLNNGVDVKQGDGKIVRSFNLAITHITHNA